MISKRKNSENSSSPSPSQKKAKYADKPATTKYLLDSFKQGDLLYGLAGDYRNELVSILNKNGYRDVYANKLNNPVVGMVVNNSKDLDRLSSSQKNHYKFLSKLRDYLIKPNGKPVPSMLNNPIEGAAYRRACKSIIRFADQSQQVHFELSGMVMERVCKRTSGDLGVSNSELLAAYRREVDYGKNPYVFFYQDGKQCLPPWEQPQYKELFDEYNQKRKVKNQ